MPTCSCKEHETFCKEFPSFKVYKCSSKKHKTKSVEKLRKDGILPPYSKYICTGCVNYCEKYMLNQEASDEPPTKKCRTEHVALVLEDIKNGVLSQDDSELLASALGSSIKDDIFNDSISINQLYQDEKYLQSFEVSDYFYQRNSVLTSFMSSAAGITESEAKKKMLLLCNALDCLYKARNLSLITPLPFSHNLITYCLTGSKTVCSMNSLSAGGGYTAIRKWLKNKSNSVLQCPPGVDVITFFDNNQVIGRNWRVVYNYKSKCSVITTVLHIIPSCATQLQTIPQLSPFQWLYVRPQMNPSVVCQKISELLSRNITECESLRNQFISDRIAAVIDAQTKANGVIFDEIDNLTNEKTLNDHTYEATYSFANSFHPPQPPKTVLGDPIFCNPCSYNSVDGVFRELLSRSLSPDGGRKWTAIGCDGLPYVLGARLIEDDPTLQNILLMPGLGHYEINMVRCVFKILWNVVIKDLAEMLGFRSVRALSSCLNCTDHHKAWQIFLILLFGTLDEILVPYVRRCLTTKSPASVSGFYDYLESAIDPNYVFLSDIVFNYLVPLFIFRCGVRKNNQKFILAGRCKFSELFYCTNMYFYQEIDFRDLKTRVLAPDEVSTFLKSNEAFSVSGLDHKGEGGDFVLEAWNRRIKRLLPPGLPTDADWLRVCRNLENVEQVNNLSYIYSVIIHIL